MDEIVKKYLTLTDSLTCYTNI